MGCNSFVQAFLAGEICEILEILQINGIWAEPKKIWGLYPDMNVGAITISPLKGFDKAKNTFGAFGNRGGRFSAPLQGMGIIGGMNGMIDKKSKG